MRTISFNILISTKQLSCVPLQSVLLLYTLTPGNCCYIFCSYSFFLNNIPINEFLHYAALSVSGLFYLACFCESSGCCLCTVVHYFLLLSSIPNLFIHLLLHESLGYFEFLSIMDKVTVNICIQVFMFLFLLGVGFLLCKCRIMWLSVCLTS